MARFTFKDYKNYLSKRSKEFNALAKQVLTKPNEWTLERWISEYRKLPKNTKQTGRGTQRTPRWAKKEWENLQKHGII